MQLTTVHPAFDVRIFHKECRALVDGGFDVVLVAPHTRSEIAGSIRIVSLPPVRNRVKRMILQSWRAFRLARREHAALYHLHDPELLPVGFLLKLCGGRVVYDVHEDVPRDILLKNWLPTVVRKPLAWIAERVEGLAGKHFDGIIAATPHIASRFPPARSIAIHNYPSLSEFAGSPTQGYQERPPNVLYVGTMAEDRGLYTMVKAIEGVASLTPCRLRLVGAIRDSDQQRLRRHAGWSSVDALGWRSRPEVVDELARARIGLVLLHRTPTFRESLPIKLFEYMAAGIPVLVSDFPLWRSIVEGARCGLVVDPSDINAVQRSLRWLIENPDEAEAMGKRGKSAVTEQYTWEREAEHLVEFYRKHLNLLANTRASTRQPALSGSHAPDS